MYSNADTLSKQRVAVFKLGSKIRYQSSNMPFPMDHSEIILLRRIGQKDQSALSQLYDRYHKILFAFAFKILLSREETEEVVADVFVQVWRTAQTYDPKKAKVDTWLFMLTRSRALDRLRRKSKGQKEQEIAKEMPIATPALDHELLVQDRIDRVKKALAQLPAEQRQVLEMAYFDGLTHLEIALKINVPLGTIKTRIRLGIMKLKQILSPQDQTL
jgi:RNA polymerase sigma factor (sigma-70 family)